MYKIYKHTTPNGKNYIGVTMQEVERRWRKGEGYISCVLFYRAICKYGWDSIEHTILEDGIKTRQEATEKEQYYISLYKSNDPRFGYNLVNGGYNGYHLNPESEEKRKASFMKTIDRERLSRNAKKQFELYGHPMKGKHLSEEAKRKISEARKGKKMPPKTKETCEKLSAALTGREFSEEHKRHISESKKGVYSGHKNPRAKAVVCVETGQVFLCAKYAAEWVGCPGGNHNIISVCTEKLKHAYGYTWRYADMAVS